MTASRDVQPTIKARSTSGYGKTSIRNPKLILINKNDLLGNTRLNNTSPPFLSS